MRNTAIFILMPLYYFYSHANSQELIHRSKREDSDPSKYNHTITQNKTKIFTSSTTTTDISNAYDCDASAIFDSDTGRMHRSIHYVLENRTTTETPPNSTVDLSVFSAEFLNCTHISIKPECYEKRPDGSVFVPMYNTVFDRSNYIINDKLLFVCSKILSRDYLTSTTATSDVSISDDCRAYPISYSDTNRTRRSLQNDLENTTTTESPPNTTRNYLIYSHEFRSCSHMYIKHGCYQKLENGSIFVPFYNMTFDQSNYLIQDEFLYVCPEKLYGPPNTTEDLSMFSEEFLNCAHIPLGPESYEIRSNGSVFVPMYNLEFNRSNHIIKPDGTLYVCSDVLYRPPVDKFQDEAFWLVSIIGSSISTICIFFHIIVFMIVKKLRNLPGYVLLSLCFALIGSYICLFLQETKSPNCTVLGMFMLYFFLAAFFWMNVMAYDVCKSIRLATAKLRLSTNRSFNVQYARYSFYAWGTPLMIIIISIIIHFSSSESSKYKLIFNNEPCWFKYKTASGLYFAFPVLILIIVNILFLVCSFFMITHASMSVSQSTSSQGNSDLWSRLLFSLRLGSVMGLMWIFGFIAAVTKQMWLWYLFSVCSALQGVFIFCSFTVSERTRKACKKVIEKRKCSVMPTQTTSQQGTSF